MDGNSRVMILKRIDQRGCKLGIKCRIDGEYRVCRSVSGWPLERVCLGANWQQEHNSDEQVGYYPHGFMVA